MKTDEYLKPIPQISEETREYWDGCKRHELRVQKCRDCGTHIWYPQTLCHKCNSWNLEWTTIAGKGAVFTYTVVHHPTGKVWESEVPYVVVIVELPAGIRMVGDLVECNVADVRIGMPVEVVFDDVTPEVTLARFKPA
jgi:uncharacterized OB-fold protein